MLCIMPRGIYIYHSARCGHINIPQSHKVFERDRLARINQNMLLDLIWSHTVSSHFDLCMMQIVSCDVCTSQARTSNFSEVKVHKLSYLEHWVVEKKMTCIERTFHLITMMAAKLHDIVSTRLQCPIISKTCLSFSMHLIPADFIFTPIFV
jgi:hypothetical protein